MKSKQTMLEEYLQEHGIDPNSKKLFRCLSPDHEDVHPSMSYDRKRARVHCFSCGYSADIYDLIQQEYHLDDFLQAKKKAQELYGKISMSPEIKTENNIKPKDFSFYVNCCHDQLTKEALDYLHARGLNDTTIEQEKIGYDSLHDRLIFPYANDRYYLGRELHHKAFYKPPLENGEEPLYHKVEKEAPYAIIVESAIDALLIEQESTHRAIALCGLGIQRLIDQQDDLPDILVLCLDQDERGRQSQQNLKKALQQNHRVLEIHDIRGYKDPDELWMNDPQQFQEWLTELGKWIKEEAQRSKRPDDLLAFAKNYQIPDQKPSYQSGFRNLDQKLCWDDHLYVLGGIPSCGKSTFCFQLAQQFAKQHAVLFFSLEQSREELLGQILERNSYQQRCSKQEALNELLSEDLRLSVIEWDPSKALIELENYVNKYQEANQEEEIIVFIDYLQLLSGGGKDVRSSIDQTTYFLKELCRRHHWMIFVVSSLNRSNYYRSMDFESFKESGGIEYSADVVLGLQYQIVHDKLFLQENLVGAKREAIQKERNKAMRKMEIICLKNRNGESGFQVPFQYEPSHALFIEGQMKRVDHRR